MRRAVRQLMSGMLCCAIWSAGELCAQQAGPDAEVPTLHVYPNLVQIPTLVINQVHESVVGIAEDRFFVSLDGGPRFQVTHVRPEGEDPISLAIVLDVSQPYPRLAAKIGDGIAELAPAELHAKDRVSIYSMDCNLGQAGENVPAEPARLRRDVDRVLEQWRTKGRDRYGKTCTQPANLWDSLMVVTSALGQQQGRRVMLVVTDGMDRGSKTRWNVLRRYAQERGVAIFGMMQTGDASYRWDVRTPENPFQSICDLSGGLVMTADERNLPERLQHFVELVRGRYIVEFPHPVDTKGEIHDMNITIRGSDVQVRPTGIGVPADDAAILKDPMTVPMDPSQAPQLGKRKVIAPN